MSFLVPKLVGDVTIKQRKSRYHGEPTYKTLSFVKPKKTKKVERWEVVGPATSGNITWEQLSPQQQQYFWAQYQRSGAQHSWATHQPHIVEASPAHHHHHHHRSLLEVEPEIKLIEPKSKTKKVDTGHAIFYESDTESIYSGSSRTSFGSTKSSKSSRSGTSSSSGSSRRSGPPPVRGW